MAPRGRIRAVEDDDDQDRITFGEVVRRLKVIEQTYVSKAEFRMLVAFLTVAAGGITTLLVTALNIRSGG